MNHNGAPRSLARPCFTAVLLSSLFTSKLSGTFISIFPDTTVSFATSKVVVVDDVAATLASDVDEIVMVATAVDVIATTADVDTVATVVIANEDVIATVVAADVDVIATVAVAKVDVAATLGADMDVIAAVGVADMDVVAMELADVDAIVVEVVTSVMAVVPALPLPCVLVVVLVVVAAANKT